MVAQTYSVTGTAAQRLVVVMMIRHLAAVVWRQANHLLVRWRSLTARETPVRGLPQLIRIRGVVVNLTVVAHVPGNVADAADAPLVVADRRPVVMVVHMVEVLAAALHLTVTQPIDEEEEQGQGERGDNATGH